MASGIATDALVIVPPLSPSETNPPLGPMILARAAEKRGLKTDILDLNIEYLQRFTKTVGVRETMSLGDHGKNRLLIAEAAAHFFADTGLPSEQAVHLPDTADARAGMHFEFETLSQAITQAATPGTFWQEWLCDLVFQAFSEPPAVVGISMMGPSQVFVALVIARLTKQHWPDSLTVLGGSHVTLLADEMATEPRYLDSIEYVLPGHSEEKFAELVCRWRDQRRPTAKIAALPAAGRPFDYHPLATPDQIARYDRATLTMPMQFTRGCVYGRCTYCTYPVVEPAATRLDAVRAIAAMDAVVKEHGVTHFSVKDSLFTVPMMLDLAEALERADIRVRWSATTKVTRSLIAHAPRLTGSGLATLEFGIETIHPRGQRLFDKITDVKMTEEVLLACAESGIAVVVNLIFGLPGETLEEAQRQLDWFATQRSRSRGLIDGSLNMLEIVRGSPLALRPPPGVNMRGIAPWAYCYDWDAPNWRPEFVREIRALELEPQADTFTSPPVST